MSRKRKEVPAYSDMGEVAFEEVSCVNPSLPFSELVVNEVSPDSIGAYKMFPGAQLPEYKTDGSACFDIFCYLRDPITTVDVFSESNGTTQKRRVQPMVKETTEIVYSFLLRPGERALVPTGLIFDIPQNQAMLIYPRSGTAIKNGISLINCTGVIDSDYTDQTMITVVNNSSTAFYVEDGMRLCQGMIVNTAQKQFKETKVRPAKKGNRNGGFGSTGK